METIKGKTWSNQYIDLALFISDYVPETTTVSTSQSLLFSPVSLFCSHQSVSSVLTSQSLLFSQSPYLKAMSIIELMPSSLSSPSMLLTPLQTSKAYSNVCRSFATWRLIPPPHCPYLRSGFPQIAGALIHVLGDVAPRTVFFSVSRQYRVKQSQAFPPKRPSGVRPQPFPKATQQC